MAWGALFITITLLPKACSQTRFAGMDKTALAVACGDWVDDSAAAAVAAVRYGDINEWGVQDVALGVRKARICS